jgi:hypothetical protein
VGPTFVTPCLIEPLSELDPFSSKLSQTFTQASNQTTGSTSAAAAAAVATATITTKNNSNNISGSNLEEKFHPYSG